MILERVYLILLGFLFLDAFYRTTMFPQTFVVNQWIPTLTSCLDFFETPALRTGETAPIHFDWRSRAEFSGDLQNYARHQPAHHGLSGDWRVWSFFQKDSKGLLRNRDSVSAVLHCFFTNRSCI